jgi:hypothetical protein
LPETLPLAAPPDQIVKLLVCGGAAFIDGRALGWSTQVDEYREYYKRHYDRALG